MSCGNVFAIRRPLEPEIRLSVGLGSRLAIHCGRRHWWSSAQHWSGTVGIHKSRFAINKGKEWNPCSESNGSIGSIIDNSNNQFVIKMNWYWMWGFLEATILQYITITNVKTMLQVIQCYYVAIEHSSGYLQPGDQGALPILVLNRGFKVIDSGLNSVAKAMI